MKSVFKKEFNKHHFLGSFSNPGLVIIIWTSDTKFL